MEEFEELTLPKTVLLKEDYDAQQRSFQGILSDAQRAYDSMRQDADVSDCLPPLAEITTKWVDDFVTEKKELVMADKSTPFKAREEICGQWSAIGKDLCRKAEAIEKLMAYDDAITIEDKGGHLIAPNASEIISQRCTWQVPAFYQEFYAKVLKAREAVGEVYECQRHLGMKYPENTTSISFAYRPEDFITYVRGIEEMQRYIEQSNQPSKFELEIRKAEKERKAKEAEHKRQLEVRRKQLAKEGKQTEYRTSIHTKNGKEISIN